MHVRFHGWSPPRNPLLRLLLAVIGLALLGFFATFGLILAAAVMAALGLRALLRQLSAAPARAGSAQSRPLGAQRDPAPHKVIEGEYRVVRRH